MKIDNSIYPKRKDYIEMKNWLIVSMNVSDIEGKRFADKGGKSQNRNKFNRSSKRREFYHSVNVTTNIVAEIYYH